MTTGLSAWLRLPDLDMALVQDLAEIFDWFTPSLKDIRTLRIEENNDFMPILDRKRRRTRQ